MPDQYVSKYVKIYDTLDARADDTSKNNTEDLVEIRLEQQRACVSIIKHCQKTALYIDDKDKMNEFVTAANHWIKKEKGIRRILVDLGQKDEGSDDDNEEGEDDEEDDEEDDDDGDRENEDDDDDDDDGDGEEEEEEEEEEDLPPPDIDTRTGKRLRY